MAYSELVKNFEKIRGYVRDFYLFGFKKRGEMGKKSARSYDDERRRVESWLSDFVRFRRDGAGKTVFLSVDTRSAAGDPFFSAFKTKSFTDGEITLHFLLFDVLEEETPKTLPVILTELDRRLAKAGSGLTFDESTVRKKLKAYADEGLVRAERAGRAAAYRRAVFPAPDCADALRFFSEILPCGALGDFILDKRGQTPSPFAFKHHFVASTLDSDVLLALFTAMAEGRTVRLTNSVRGGERETAVDVVPVKILRSAENGRQHLFAFVPGDPPRFSSFRADRVVNVALREKREDYPAIRRRAEEVVQNVWGVSAGPPGERALQHVEFTVRYGPGEGHIPGRLLREKRCGNVEILNDHSARFSAEVADASELIPWARTPIGRLTDVRFGSPGAQERFLSDIQKMAALYGLDEGGGNE